MLRVSMKVKTISTKFLGSFEFWVRWLIGLIYFGHGHAFKILSLIVVGSYFFRGI